MDWNEVTTCEEDQQAITLVGLLASRLHPSPSALGRKSSALYSSSRDGPSRLKQRFDFQQLLTERAATEHDIRGIDPDISSIVEKQGVRMDTLLNGCSGRPWKF